MNTPRNDLAGSVFFANVVALSMWFFFMWLLIWLLMCNYFLFQRLSGRSHVEKMMKKMNIIAVEVQKEKNYHFNLYVAMHDWF